MLQKSGAPWRRLGKVEEHLKAFNRNGNFLLSSSPSSPPYTDTGGAADRRNAKNKNLLEFSKGFSFNWLVYTVPTHYHLSLLFIFTTPPHTAYTYNHADIENHTPRTILRPQNGPNFAPIRLTLKYQFSRRRKCIKKKTIQKTKTRRRFRRIIYQRMKKQTKQISRLFFSS